MQFHFKLLALSISAISCFYKSYSLLPHAHRSLQHSTAHPAPSLVTGAELQGPFQGPIYGLLMNAASFPSMLREPQLNERLAPGTASKTRSQVLLDERTR